MYNHAHDIENRYQLSKHVWSHNLKYYQQVGGSTNFQTQIISQLNTNAKMLLRKVFTSIQKKKRRTCLFILR